MPVDERNAESVIDSTKTARHNYGARGSFPRRELEKPFAEGSFRRVAKGTYTAGPRTGQLMVCKWFKTPSFKDDKYIKHDLKAVDKALEIISQWNVATSTKIPVRLNKPEVWILRDKERKVLVEPFIDNYKKYNSNSGWNDTSTWQARLLQALSHYSFHVTKGEIVLCDLQGGVRRDCIILSDPVILSKNRDFGSTDLGPKGIESFFRRHKCTEYCERDWLKPDRKAKHFPAVRHTIRLANAR